MAGFKDIIGQENIKEHMQNAIQMDKVSHAYIIQGELGAGKEFIAKVFAKTIQCERSKKEPCEECRSCKQMDGRNHPDVIWVTHEKPNSIGVEDVRRQINNDIIIKPYSSEYKVYITGTDQAGNKSERAEVTVNVVESYDGEKLDKMLDGIVEKLDVEGKSREQICREIYKYVRKELDYTGDSQKGDARRAAYYALLGGGGDCYSYFSLSKLLLDRCGIESLDIERLPTKSAETHFWSLVNIGEGEEQRWYHFDSTELRADRYEHSGCLLTEKQINAYSKARADFYLYDTSLYPKTAEEIITPTPRLEELY